MPSYRSINKKKHLFIALLPLLFFLVGCKKDKTPPKSSSKNINSFIFYQQDNPALSRDIVTHISNDTIYIAVSIGTGITQLAPTITYSGTSISPASKVAQNFSSTVLYKVTAEDGSVKTYKTFARYLANSKEITSFIFEKSNNAGLSKDIAGIISGDSILVNLPTDVNLSSLVPTIVHTGVSISPANRQTANFTYPVYYSVSAEDGSIRTYTVFASANKFIFIQGEDGYLYAINAMSGSIAWKYFSGGRGNYTYHNGIVFISGGDNTVYALHANDGSLKWTKAPPRGNFNMRLPVVKNGKLYFSGSGLLTYPNSNLGYYCDFIYALHEETGTEEWIHSFVVNSNAGQGPLNIAVDENIACVYDLFNGIYVFDANSGNELWHAADILGRANPVIFNNTIFYTNESGLRAVVANTGTLVWQLIKGYSSPTILGNIIYCLGGQTLYAINLQTGSDAWQAPNLNNYYYTPSVYNNSVFSTLSNHFLISYNATNGNVNWQKEGFNGEYLVAANHDLYICTANNKLACLDAATGVTKWTASNLPDFIKPFCIVDYQDNLFHVTDSGERN